MAGVGAIGNRSVFRQETSIYNTLTAQKTITKNLKVNALLGSELNILRSLDQGVVGNTTATRDFLNINNAANFVPFEYLERKRLIGVYANVDLAYKDWAFVQLTGRNDWSSTFRKSNRNYFYPSFSGSVILTDAILALKGQDVLTFAKLKTAWAKVGREADTYSTDVYYEPANPQDGWPAQIVYPFLGVLGRRLQDAVGNPNLGPEFTRSWEVGTELRFWKNRVSIDLTHFNQRSTNIILSVPVASASGFLSVVQNAGVLESGGWE